MKCFSKSNIFMALFLIICLAETIIIRSNSCNKNSKFSKPENLNFTKKIREADDNILEIHKKFIYGNLSKKINIENGKIETISLKNNFPLIISFACLTLGFLLAGMFTVFAFLYSK